MLESSTGWGFDHFGLVQFFCMTKIIELRKVTVDGRNPAPVDR